MSLQFLSPKKRKGETMADLRERQKWKNDNYICAGHILNGLCGALFDFYQDSISAKDLWEKLEARYMKEYATTLLEKFIFKRKFWWISNKFRMYFRWKIFRLKKPCSKLKFHPKLFQIEISTNFKLSYQNIKVPLVRNLFKVSL